MWLRVTIPALYVLKTREMQRNDSDAVMEFYKAPRGKKLLGYLLMSLSGGLLGVGKSYIRQPKEGDEVRAAVNETQGTKGADGRGGPQKSTGSRGRQTREVAGEVTRPSTPK